MSWLNGGGDDGGRAKKLQYQQELQAQMRANEEASATAAAADSGKAA